MSFDVLQEILFTVKKNKLRTFLTAFGVFWGILMLILLLGSGKGLQNGAESRFGSDDRSSIWLSSRVTAQAYDGLPRGRKINFDEYDIAAILREIPGVQFISAENRAGERWQRTININYKNKTGAFGVYGVADDYFKIKKYLDYPAGRTLNSLDASETRKVALVGTRVRDRLFGKEMDPVGETISFHGILLKVVGVFHDEGREGRMSERVYVPLTTFQLVFGEGKKVGGITLTPKPNIDPYMFEEDVVSLLKFRHRIAPDDVKAIRVFNSAKNMESVTQLFIAINAFVWFVGIGTLIAGIVGVSNIMIITVKDRTREIGVRKALGATPSSIVAMIISESIIITAFAGYLGLVLGVGILEIANTLLAKSENTGFFVRPEVDIQNAILAIFILVIAGSLAGLAPALRAAKILPVEAMRE